MDIVQKVSELIEKIGIGNPPIVITDILEHLNLEAKLAKFENDNVLGMLCKNIIYINEKQSNLNSRFVIAHEVGHYILENFNRDTNDVVYSRDIFSDNSSKEKIANIFAAELLIPTEFLRKDLKRIQNDFRKNGIDFKKNIDLIIEALAKIYFVTHDIMRFRLEFFDLSFFEE